MSNYNQVPGVGAPVTGLVGDALAQRSLTQRIDYVITPADVLAHLSIIPMVFKIPFPDANYTAIFSLSGPGSANSGKATPYTTNLTATGVIVNVPLVAAGPIAGQVISVHLTCIHDLTP